MGTPNQQTILSRIRVVIYPYKFHFAMKNVRSRDIINSDFRDITSAVTECSYTKTKADASGTFSITLKPTQNWTDIIRPGDWLMIYQSQFPINIKTAKGLQVLGNVDRSAKRKIIDPEGKKSIEYTLMGRDWGKVLEQTTFYYDPYTNKEEQIKKIMLTKAGYILEGSPRDFLNTYFNIYFGDGRRVKDKVVKEVVDKLDQMRLPSEIYEVFGITKRTANLSDLVRLEFQDVKGNSWFVPMAKALNNNVWEIFKAISNPLINELYTCMRFDPKTGNIFPCIVLREIPFQQKKFSRLQAHVISDDHIIGEDIGFSDHERVNWITFDSLDQYPDDWTNFAASIGERVPDEFGSGSSIVIEGKTGKSPLFPYIDDTSIKRYGLRMQRPNTEFAQFFDSNNQASSLKTYAAIAAEWQKKLVEIWFNQPRTESGTIITKGIGSKEFILNRNPHDTILNNQKIDVSNIKKIETDHLTVGNNIFLKDQGRLFHLEGYEWHWQAPGITNTTMVVIRGVLGDPNKFGHKYRDDAKEVEQLEVNVSVVVRKDDSEDDGSSDGGSGSSGNSPKNKLFGN